MNILIILALLICNPSRVQAELQEQALEILPIRRTAPKHKTYPILEQFEAILYPGKNFSREAPNARLERIEIAVFGNKQNATISLRIKQLQAELDSWEIAQAQTSSTKPSVPTKQVITPAPKVSYPPRAQYNTTSRNNKKIDYDYMNYRMFSPLVQTLGRKGIQNAFDRD